MRVISFKIFEKKEGIHIVKQDWITLGFVGIIFCVAIFLRMNYNIGVGWLVYPSLIPLLIFVEVYRFYNLNEIEHEHGSYNGHLTLEKDCVLVNGVEFGFEQIQKIDFENNYDFRGRALSDKRTFYPSLSNGLRNKFVLILKNGEKIELNFLQTEDHQIGMYDELLIHYYKSGLLDWLLLLRLLKIDKYEDIQRFKEELSVGQKG